MSVSKYVVEYKALTTDEDTAKKEENLKNDTFTTHTHKYINVKTQSKEMATS
jgi:hypothetical protein